MLQILKAGEKLPKSKYKGVFGAVINGKYVRWEARIRIKGKIQHSSHQTEREAAVKYDVYLIKDGRAPVNILKKLTTI